MCCVLFMCVMCACVCACVVVYRVAQDVLFGIGQVLRLFELEGLQWVVGVRCLCTEVGILVFLPHTDTHRYTRTHIAYTHTHTH